MAGNRPLGDFLRSRRTRLKPEELRHATRQRRRTPGLKREEVAERAGISAEWYVKLEQGRALSPPAETVEALEHLPLTPGHIRRRQRSWRTRWA